jgi:hypothetical protein
MSHAAVITTEATSLLVREFQKLGRNGVRTLSQATPK